MASNQKFLSELPDKSLHLNVTATRTSDGSLKLSCTLQANDVARTQCIDGETGRLCVCGCVRVCVREGGPVAGQ